MKPKLPFEGATIEFHNKNSVWKGAELWLSEEQKTGYIKWNKLRKQIPKTAYNACVLDYLLENPKEIPKEWEVKCVFFWGTIFGNSNRNSSVSLYVRYLYFNDGQWYSYCHWLDHDWSRTSPSAVRAFSPKKSPKKLDTKPSFDTLPLTLEINGFTYKRVWPQNK